MNEHANALPIPAEVHGASDSGEVIRVWAVDGSLAVALNPRAFEDVAVFGIMLADIAFHIARAREAEGLGSAAEQLFEILEMLNNETQAPTDVGTTEKITPRREH